jgi:tetraacyldisaccharide 4'-kinase
MLARRKAYKKGLLPKVKLEIPVISVGNLTLGGNAKTPMCLFLAQAFTNLGIKTAILSRGYRRQPHPLRPDPVVVSLGQGPIIDPLESGDEPYLLALQSKAIVILAKKRVLAGREAIKLGAQALILDDGFQHLNLERDLDLLMLQASSPFDEALILPAGRLRERPQTHLLAHILVAAGLSLSPETINLAQGRPLFLASHKLKSIRPLKGGPNIALDGLQNLRLGAFCGLARPESFKMTLSSANLKPLIFLPFGDHARYDQKSLNLLNQVIIEQKIDYFLTTTKDAVKLNSSLQTPILVVETNLEIENIERFLALVLDKLGLSSFSSSLKPSKAESE